MAIKVLGQLAPSATTLSTLYTSPSGNGTVCSTLTACNRDTTAGTMRVAVRPAGAAISNEHYIYYDINIPAKETFAATLGITLAATDVVSVYASSANMSFNLFGEEL
jgi:hypothetical protein